MQYIDLTSSFVKSMDSIAIFTDHSSLGYSIISNDAKIIINIRGVFK